MFKKVAFVLLGLILVVGLVSSVVSAQKIGIRFLTDETDPESMEADRFIIKTFEEKYPNVKVIPEYVSLEDTYLKVMSMIAANMEPDLYYTTNDRAYKFYQMGKLVPLDDVQKRIGEDFDPKMLSWGKFGGRLYSIPTQTGQNWFWFRKDLVAERGLTPPTNTEEVLDFVKNLTIDKDGDGKPEIYGISVIAAESYNLQARFIEELWRRGGYQFGPEGKTVVMGTTYREESLDALRYMKELTKYAPPGFVGHGYSEQGLNYGNGLCATVVYPGRLTSRIVQTNPEIFDVSTAIAVPPPPGGKRVTWGGPNVWVLFKRSDYPEVVKDYIVHFMTGEQYAKFLLSVPLHLTSVRKSFLRHPTMLANPIVKKLPDVFELSIELLPTIWDRGFERDKPLPYADSCFGGKSMAKAITKMYMGELTPEQALDRFVSEWERITRG